MQAFGPFGSGVMTYFSVRFGARPLTAGSDVYSISTTVARTRYHYVKGRGRIILQLNP